MRRKRKEGWWEQLQSDEYPKTKTNYGDSRAADWRPDSHNGNKEAEIQTHKKIKKPKKIEKPTIAKTRYRYTIMEEHLLRKNRGFYSSLETGSRVPKTEAQKHFVEVCRGRAKPETTHEKAYIKFIRNRDQTDTPLTEE